ncbi:sensor histidine kinase [Sphaerisporangium corydalis]|uniref:histidine kinase n=1 Tax=Sphaerisporangium corydalis TaxID=1441875 RepID=A0ABV9EIY2_9ACTN|nr:HAMP domain-containing sensor histidine kinase [Sphaerisporangium corydalis]
MDSRNHARVPATPDRDGVPEMAGEIGIGPSVQNAALRLERLSRALECQRRFASDASHELRTPVAGLRAELEEARMHPGEDDVRDVIDRALCDVGRLEAIINDLLLLSRSGVDAPRREPVDLAELVEAEVALRSDPLRIRLRLTRGVVADAVRIQICRVLTNLLDNAQRHARRIVSVELGRTGRVAELAVSDDGEGIAEADRERIFERFTRLDAARALDRDGSGLGLAIAREIAQAHHGTLDAGPSPLGGARVTLRLPLTGG